MLFRSYAHFSVSAEGHEVQQSEELQELQEDQGGAALAAPDSFDVVARLDQTSRVRTHEPAELWINAEKIHFFDPDSGRSLAAS